MNTQVCDPLVSILTPVHNGARYLGQCIESVLAQSYSNYEYVIVNNCSTDNTLDIALGYADSDPRIKVVSNTAFVDLIANHNVACRSISGDSRYCKIVSADDWIYPNCLQELIEVAEQNPSVGIVQGYSINLNGVRWPRLPLGTSVFDGRRICKLYLLGHMEFCAAPSACLYRSTLVRATDSFFPGPSPSADVSAWLNCLQTSDLGVVHQILSFERIHEGAASTRVRELSSYLLDRIDILQRYGPLVLSRDAMQERLDDLLREYYDMLATAVVNCRGKKFWTYHRARLHGAGLPLVGVKLARGLLLKCIDLTCNPKQTVEKIISRIGYRLNSNSGCDSSCIDPCLPSADTAPVHGCEAQRANTAGESL